jgi:xanthine dehydrogenase accessory factor
MRWPGFVAGDDCHAVIETIAAALAPRDLGAAQEHRVPTESWAAVVACCARPRRVLPTPPSATSWPRHPHATGEGQCALPRRAGSIHDGLAVTPGSKIGDLDARAAVEHCFTISDKSLAVAGGVLEAILSFGVRRV